MQFGLYLKKKGIISADALVAALEAQLAQLPRIGQLALEEGILSPRDIFNVLLAQRRAPEIRFGELAIEMSLMTRNELIRLLMVQSDRQQPLAEVFVTEGILSQEVVARHLAEFRQMQANHRAVNVDFAKVVPAPRGVPYIARDAELGTAI